MTLVNNTKKSYGSISYSFENVLSSLVHPFRKENENFIVVNITVQANNNYSSINTDALENLSLLDSFFKLAKNWNGYGADPLSEKAINNAKKAIVGLRLQPEIFPVADGSVQFEYDRNKSHLEIQIFDDHIETLQEKNGLEEENNYAFDVNKIKEVVDLFYE